MLSDPHKDGEQIVYFLELTIDPASSIALEAEPGNPHLRERPPRDPREPVFGKRTVIQRG